MKNNIFAHGGLPRRIEPKMDAISILADQHWKLAKEKDPNARYEDSLRIVTQAEPRLWDNHVHAVTTDH